MLGQGRGGGNGVSAGRDERFDHLWMTDDRVLLAHGRHEPNDHLRGRLHARQQVADQRGDHHSHGHGDAGTRQQGDRREQRDAANPFWTRESVPEGPEPTPRCSGQRAGLQLEAVENLVDELDGGVSVAFTGNADGIAEPEARTIRVDRPDPFEMGEQGKMGERRRAAAVKENNGAALTRLDQMDAPPRAGFEVPVPDLRVGEDPVLDESRYVYVEAGITVLLALARGRRSWADVMADGSIAAFGNPDLVSQLPSWFQSVDESSSGGVPRPNLAAAGVALPHAKTGFP